MNITQLYGQVILTLIFADSRVSQKLLNLQTDENEFAKAWSKFQIDFTHTYEVNDISNTSTQIISYGVKISRGILLKQESYIYRLIFQITALFSAI